jgi:hypothetical protein
VSGNRDVGRGEHGPVRGVQGPAGAGGGVQPRASVPDETVEIPATTRIGPRGGPGRGLRALVALVALGIVLAVVKPWAWFAPPPEASAPGPEGTATAASGRSGSTPVPSPWTDLSERIACFSDWSWMAVVDWTDGPTSARSWTRLDPVPATGPTDRAIAATHLYADSVLRIGFCAPAADSLDARVRAWRLVPEPAAGAAEATEVALVPVAGGSAADHGALYEPPILVEPGATARAGPDPEGAWSVGGSLAPRPAGWSPGRARAAAAWPPGTYVFHVQVGGSGSVAPDAAWFAIDLRGPWIGPDGVAPAGRPTPTPDPTPAGATPGAVPAPVSLP